MAMVLSKLDLALGHGVATSLLIPLILHIVVNLQTLLMAATCVIASVLVVETI